jgi:alanine racemase
MPFYRDTFIEIDLDAVYQNVMNLKKYFYRDLEIMAVIKADSYGHGALMVAKTLLEAGVGHFAVATLDEGLELRNHGITQPILVFGGVDVKYLDIAADQDLTVSVHSLCWLNKALKAPQAKPLQVQLKIDTGMHRLGFFDEREFREALALIRNDAHFQLTGIYSHLATAEEKDETYYGMQIRRFESMLENIDKKGLFIHIGNSAGSIKPPPPSVNMVRIGLFLNGICPGKAIQLPFRLRPSLSLYSTVIQVRTLPPGSKISYNGLYETTGNAIIATIPIGYADGYDRRMKDGKVWIAGRYAKVVGRICMDSMMVELEGMVEEGTRVELIGPHIPIDEYCTWVGTNNYHATCAFTDRVPRIYQRNGKIVNVVNRRLDGHS